MPTRRKVSLDDGLVGLNAQVLKLAASQLLDADTWHRERAKLLEERSWLRAMIDQVPDYLFVKDRANRFVIANRAVAADLGRTAESIIGLTDVDVHAPNRSAEFMADDTRVIASGEPMIDKEEFVILPSGEHRWLLTSKLPLRDETGAIVGLVGVARDITLRKQAEEQVRQLAYFDPLTGLPNRASFEINLSSIAAKLNSDEEARLLLIDLDRFKHVNDSLGHAAGDDLLRAVGERLSSLVEKNVQLARLGGDEFIVIKTFESAQTEREFCDRLIAQLDSFRIMGNVVHVGASVGVAKVHRLTTPFAALREADIALYEAKSRGRNRWQRFERLMGNHIESRLQLEADLRAAIGTAANFPVHYQPIFSADARQIVGAEALVRWQHAGFGLLGPDRFIALAEDIGAIGTLGDHVLENAISLLARTSLQWVAVNVSPLQLKDASFFDRLVALLERYDVQPSRLELEITEGMILEEAGSANGLLEALRRLGVRLAIDDFGTGYSSLNYLRRLAVDKIKIDRSFVQAIGAKDADAIVKAVIAFAKALDVTVTAEGVETEQQLHFLRAAKCDQLQGFLLSRPVVIPDLHALLDAQLSEGAAEVSV